MSTHNIPFSKYKRKRLIIPNLQLWDSFQGAQERVRNSRGKRAISVRATEVLLYLQPIWVNSSCGKVVKQRSSVVIFVWQIRSAGSNLGIFLYIYLFILIFFLWCVLVVRCNKRFLHIVCQNK